MSASIEGPVAVADDLVLAIGDGNLMAHVGPARDILGHVELAHQGLIEPRDLEFYTSTGVQISFAELRRLAAPDAPSGTGSQASRYVDGKQQAALLDRIHAGLALAQEFLDEHPEAGNQGPNATPMTRVPTVSGTFPEVLLELHRLFVPLTRPDHRGNVFHNLWHAATGT